MRLTTKGRYAVTAMLDLALHSNNNPTTLADVAERQGISLSYLEQLFSRLRKNNLVKSIRGPGGGYVLNSPASDITIAQVIKSVDENIDSTKCGGDKNCHNKRACLTHDLWMELSASIYTFLNDVSLQSLIDRQDKDKVLAAMTQPSKQVTKTLGAEFLVSSVRP